MRDCINATVGFPALSKETHIPEKSLMRMVGPHGNPTANNLFAMVTALQHQTHVETHVEPTRRSLRSNAPIAPSNSSCDAQGEKGRSQARNENEKARMTTRKA